MPAAADIIKIDAPSSAQAGEQVIVDISVKNISGSDLDLSVTAVYDSAPIPFQFDYLLVAPGQTVIFRGWFTMPNKGVRVTAWGWYWTGTEWIYDDTMYIDIALEGVVPEYAGTISRKELEYDHVKSSIPVY